MRRPSSAQRVRDEAGFVADRFGHDLRDAVDSGKAGREPGRRPREASKAGLAKAVRGLRDSRT
ncbi:hypothetical protein BDS110ZK25_62640 [Bradyrhizobium diazoefficiens]|nr:hypothetical protein AAV28_08665 [Bradyrhizobium diazoefficiens USDA 110]PDT57923.1 hypothetical protein CO678_31310 [Bradyrhizobium diazoefficiens]QBP21182.1 hypothetical protein Bdiaspc4_12055 [Bradyrhizobium diazoefficiens]BBZ92805.1 hypothetical protein F07S3_26380 [Bradyrhizobium diazoefficiens]BCA01909.1 hypothetical protein H12S4_28130 [Bradyrhizobium diazoefficiens]